MSNKILDHLCKLGFKAEDRVTGAKGTITSICFDLYGCVQGLLNTGLDKDGKLGDQCWFDLNRLKITSTGPVMTQPACCQAVEVPLYNGPAEKPAACKP